MAAVGPSSAQLAGCPHGATPAWLHTNGATPGWAVTQELSHRGEWAPRGADHGITDNERHTEMVGRRAPI